MSSASVEMMIQYGLSFLGVPYRWGGENPITGFDCSGFVQELLRSIGMDPPGDQGAQALYNCFVSKASHSVLDAGALSFYGKSLTQITHVAMMIDAFHILEAAGGDHLTLSKDEAAIKNAFVRIRPVKARSDFLITLLPQYN